MGELAFISCIRFSLQLMMAESIFAFRFPRKKFFIGRLLLSEGAFFLFLRGIYLVMIRIQGNITLLETIYYVLVFLLTLIVMKTCFHNSGEEILFAGIGGYAVQHISYAIARILQYLIDYDDSTLWTGLWLHVIPYILVPVGVYYLIIRKYGEKGELKEKDKRMILLALATLITTVVISLLTRSDFVGEGNVFLQKFICNIYSAFCCILILFILFYIPRENKLFHEQEMLEQIIRVMGEQQHLSRENIEIINRKCHDIKHQLKALMNLEDQKEREAYADEIRSAISMYDAIYQTGNSALDFVLREKGFMCQEYDIKFSCMADGKILNFIDTLDIYALFGNALDNAIESVIKEPDEEKRIINLHITKKEQLVYIHLDNYCKEIIVFEDEVPVTNKADKNYHGFGIRSIRHIAEKYDGELVLRQHRERFILDILLPFQ